MKSLVLIILFIISTIQARPKFETIYDFMFSFKRTPYHTDVPPHSRPFLAHLLINKNSTCSGVLISPNYVLTSASCVYGYVKIIKITI